MIPTEIERKFTLKYLPENIESIYKITQKHVFKDMVCSIRVRKMENLFEHKVTYTHTIKARGDNVKKYSIYELEKNISKEEYESLPTMYGSRKIEKYRCIVPINQDLKAEIDIFDGWMKGLIIAEVEFKTVEQAENFVMPDWFKTAVPNREFSNRRLSQKNRKEILEMIGEAQLKINKNILKKLQEVLAKK